jgi:hypothetical protein
LTRRVVQVEEDEESGEDFTKDLDEVPVDSGDEEQEQEEEEPKPKKKTSAKKATSGTASKKRAPSKKVCPFS